MQTECSHPVDMKVPNNVVALSDFQEALRGAERSIDLAIERDDSKENRPHNEMKNALLNVKASFNKNMGKVVKVLRDEEYYREYVKDSEGEDQIDMESCSADDLASIMSEPSVEYDEEALLDAEAVKRARELRGQLRVVAERMHNSREAVTTKVLSLAEKSNQASRLPLEEIDFDIAKLNQRMDESSIAGASSDTPDHPSELDMALRSLISATDEVEGQLTPALQSLSGLIDTVEQNLGGESHLSQTERAIRSRSNEGPERKEIEEVSKSAVARLASFFQRY